MSTEHVLDDGIKSIKDAWQREHTARFNLERMLENTEAENAKLRELLGDALKTLFHKRLDGSVGCTENCPRWQFGKDFQLVDGCWLELEAARLGIEVDGWFLTYLPQS